MIDFRAKAAVVLWMGIPLWEDPNRNLLVISGTPYTSSYQGSAYVGFTVTSVGGNGTYTYSLIGPWPTGITINSTTGVVSGTPTVAGGYSGLSVRVTDSNSATDEIPSFSLTVIPTLEITGTPVTTADMAVAYTGFTVVAEGGVAAYTYALVGTWPAGITIDPNTGVVSGVPAVAGTFASLSVSVTDSQGNTDQLSTFTLTVSVPSAGFQLLGYGNNHTGTPTLPTYVIGDLPVLFVTVSGQTNAHGGVAPSLPAPWVLKGTSLGGTNRALALYAYEATTMAALTAVWADANCPRSVWAFKNAEFDTFEFINATGSTSLTYPLL